MTNFEWFYKRVTDYCIMKLGLENKYTVNLFNALDNFDDELIKILNTFSYDTFYIIMQQYFNAINEEAKKQCLK